LENLYYSIYGHPVVGSLYVIASDAELITLAIGEDDFERQSKKYPAVRKHDHPLFQQLFPLLDAYFSGEEVDFQIPLRPAGTPFQRAVWEQMKLIPYGETKSYSEIAEEIDRPKAVRAVGQASRANPFPFIVPCHRIVGKNGALTGYAGSRVNIKEWLLQLEKETAASV
jgi:methylated-DNA-[protein]-cysteine S-methyltransferase